MNKLSTIHLHTNYSDGVNKAYEYVEEAIRLRLKTIGISDHSPVPFNSAWAMKKENLSKYIEELDYLKRTYKKHISVYAGMELDYIQGYNIKKYIDFDNLNLDYFIGSVHYIYSEITDSYGTADNSQEEVEKLISNGFNNNGVLFYKKYYQTVQEMIKEYDPIMIAHIDVLEKRNRNYELFNPDTEEYKNQIENTLNCINKSCVEVNTGAMAKNIDVMYPSKYILKQCFKKKIPVSVNSDCHFISGLQYGYDKAKDTLLDIGYTHIFEYDGKFIKKEL